MQWIPVVGGVLPAGRWRPRTMIADLWWTAVPVSTAFALNILAPGSLPGEPLSGPAAALPVTGLPRRQAAQVAAALGGRLPTAPEWEWMAGRGRRRYPWGEQAPRPDDRLPLANLRGIGPDRPTPVGVFRAGATPDGLLDVAGNVWEWTSSPAAGGYVICGGSYRALALYARCDYVNEVPEHICSPGIGLRVVRPA